MTNSRKTLDSHIKVRLIVRVARKIMKNKRDFTMEAKWMRFYTYCKKHGKEYLLEQWDEKKNAPLHPTDIGSTNTTRVWWKCEADAIAGWAQDGAFYCVFP
jgi:hypothetical protein